MIAALFVATDGIYFNRNDVEPYDIKRNAFTFQGGMRVLAHPPCERWGRYWGGGPNPKARRFEKGDDGGCFAFAKAAVDANGGALEHPEASHAWAAFGIPRPPKSGGWIPAGDRAWTCCVEQGHYGHPARKATWLYFVGDRKPPDLIWGPSRGQRLDEGFHSREERAAARAGGAKPRRRLSTKERIGTPPAFAELLLGLVQ